MTSHVAVRQPLLADRWWGEPTHWRRRAPLLQTFVRDPSVKQSSHERISFFNTSTASLSHLRVTTLGHLVGSTSLHAAGSIVAVVIIHKYADIDSRQSEREVWEVKYSTSVLVCRNHSTLFSVVAYSTPSQKTLSITISV